jgi:hypothetical protein
MAKATKAASKSLKKGTLAFKECPRYNVAAITLLDIDLDVGFEDEEKVELFYGIAVGTPEKLSDGKYAFIACANAGQQLKENDESVAFIQAKYGVVMDIDALGKEGVLIAAKDCAKNTIWGRFAVWFSATASQLPISLPPLPAFPSEVDFDEELKAIAEEL